MFDDERTGEITEKPYHQISIDQGKVKRNISCPDCNSLMIPAGGCLYCPICGYSPCK